MVPAKYFNVMNMSCYCRASRGGRAVVIGAWALQPNHLKAAQGQVLALAFGGQGSMLKRMLKQRARPEPLLREGGIINFDLMVRYPMREINGGRLDWQTDVRV